MKADDGGEEGLSYGNKASDREEGFSFTEEDPPETSSPSKQKSTFFTDENGILKFVNLVCHRPFTILIVTFILINVFCQILFRIQDGNPFSDETKSSYDLGDIRSKAHDSLKLAYQEISDDRKEDGILRTQEESIDFTYWVWESEKDTGVFGDTESIEGMKEAMDIFLEADGYEDYCLREYFDDGTSQCQPPFSSLRIYYASAWDFDAVDDVLLSLKETDVLGSGKDGVTLFNELSLCEFTSTIPFCVCITAPVDELPADCTPEALLSRPFYQELNGKIDSIMDQWDGRGEIVPSEKLEVVTEFASYMIQLLTKRGLTEFGYDTNFNSTNPISMYSRAILEWGSPLPEVTSIDDDAQSDPELTQQEKDGKVVSKWVSKNLLKDMNTVARPKHNPNVNSYYFMGSLLLDVLLDVLITDAIYVIVSLMLVGALIYFGTGSFFLACIGWWEIVLTVPVSWFIYKAIFQIELFPGLNSLSIFIVAAIGADDIFVFMDAYKQSAFMPEVLESLEKRMDYVYRRSGLAMAVTSATTCTAFLCTLITPIPTVQAFGVFAAIVIFIDYVLVMTLFCSAVVIYHNKFEGRSCCQCSCKTSDPNPTEMARQLASGGDWDEHGDNADSFRRSIATREKGEKVSIFFREKVSSFVFNPLVRIVLGVVFTGWVCGAIYLTTKLEATKEADPFFRESHPLQRSVNIITNEFDLAELAGEPGLEVYFAWGLGFVNRRGVNLFFRDDFVGKPTYDIDFDFNEQCQDALLEICDDLTTNEAYEPHIQRSQGQGKVNCFIKELAAFRVYGENMTQHCEEVLVNGKEFWDTQDWTIPAEEIDDVMKQFVDQPSCQPDALSRSMISYYDEEIGWDGRALKYAAVSVESPELTASGIVPESVARKEYNAFIAISETADEIALEACRGPTIMTDLNQKFVFMNSQRLYVQSAISSAALGIAIAFTVLLLTTKVLHIAAFAAVSITFTLLSVTGAMVLNGWSVGPLESILITILAGFSIDYVVHLAHAYKEASGDTTERIKTAFGEMGVSVLNGMLTSVGASIPMFFTTLVFFSKFAFFLCFTILFSWVFANFGFMSVLATLKIPIVKRKWGFSW